MHSRRYGGWAVIVGCELEWLRLWAVLCMGRLLLLVRVLSPLPLLLLNEENMVNGLIEILLMELLAFSVFLV